MTNIKEWIFKVIEMFWNITFVKMTTVAPIKNIGEYKILSGRKKVACYVEVDHF